ncbi:MAG: hypothetical protein R2751_11520 [Bacteroidales bacterium]
MLDTLEVGDPGAGTSGQVAVLHGRLTDRNTGRPLVGATMYFSGTEAGHRHGRGGQLTMVVRPGGYTVEFSAWGWRIGWSGCRSISQEPLTWTWNRR